MVKIGIIGGTGLDQDGSLLQKRQLVPLPETPYGKPSDPEAIYGLIDGVEVYIIGRHGRGHSISPSNVNYRANLWCLKRLGVTHVLATTACGSLQAELEPGHLATVDQYIDRTSIRTGRSFYTVAHIPQARPFDVQLQHMLEQSAQEAGHVCHGRVTAVCIEGPRFSTLAESRLYQAWGAHLVNMTLVPEVQLASELGLVYASLALVTDYDCWHSPELSVSVELVTKMLQSLAGKARDVLLRTIAKVKQHDWTGIVAEKQLLAKSSIMLE